MRGALLAVLAVLVAAPAVAQERPGVRAAVQLAAEGRSDSARILIEQELARSRPGEPAYVEALFWRARLAVSGTDAERDLRRVAIEYSTSAWADDALLQLTQLALAAGNPASALELAARLRGDYPESDLRPQAALWGARAAFEVGEPRAACALLDSARVDGASDIEFVNQVQFYRSRCTSRVAAPVSARPVPLSDSTRTADSTRGSAPVARADSAATAPPRRAFEVQVAAARDAASATDLVRRLARAGLTARAVRGDDGLYRVRLGPFAAMPEADSSAAAARRAVGGSPFVVRVP